MYDTCDSARLYTDSRDTNTLVLLDSTVYVPA